MTIYISDGRNKVYRFILCYIVYFVVSQNALFTVIPGGGGVKERQNDHKTRSSLLNEGLHLYMVTCF